MTARCRYTIPLVLLFTAALAWVRTGAAAIPREQDFWQLLTSRYQASSENYAEPLLEEFERYLNDTPFPTNFLPKYVPPGWARLGNV